MDGLQLILLVIAVLLGVAFCIALIKKKEVIVERIIREEVKPPNKRENYRLRVKTSTANLEVINIGEQLVNENVPCEIVDVSRGGVGIYCDKDYPLRQNVVVKIQFILNGVEFTLDGKLVRKIEYEHKHNLFYGIEFKDLPMSTENMLGKAIATIENNRRKISVK